MKNSPLFIRALFFLPPSFLKRGWGRFLRKYLNLTKNFKRIKSSPTLLYERRE
jgi:hypothetical protein